MEKPSYFAIMPASVRYDERLKATEKIIYAEITALVNSKGYCYATNLYFARLYGVHKNSVGNWINNLIKYGYLRVEYVVKEKDGEKKQERRIYIIDIKEIREAKEEVEEKVIVKKIKDSSGVETKNIELEEEEKGDTNLIEGVSQKNVIGSQSKMGDPINENIEENNTSRLLKENNYYIYTYRGDENLPIMREILKKYNELGLPPYEYPPEKNLVMKAYGELGAEGVFKGLEIMSKSNFVMEKMCVDTILKVENLKKALNGNFKAEIEKDEDLEDLKSNNSNRKKSKKNKGFQESEEGKRWKEEQEEKITKLLEKSVDEEDIPELFSVEELFGKR